MISLRPTGRLAVVYGKRCPQSLLEHEVWVSELEYLLGVLFERDVQVGKAKPDGITIKNGVTYAYEVDNAAKQSRQQYAKKWESYGSFQGLILVVCHTERRMKSVIEWCEAVRKCSVFNTFERIRAGKPWLDGASQPVAL